MSLKEDILAKVAQAKREAEIPVHDGEGRLVSRMVPMRDSDEEVRCIADWREQARDWYPTVFPYNVDNTKKWVRAQVIGNPERILFFLETPEGERWGHLGLATFRWEGEPFCEVDAVMRGREDVAPGAMAHAVRALLRWTEEELGVRDIGLRVFADNERAIRLYERTGFVREELLPLYFEQGDPISAWRPVREGEEVQRHNLVMRFVRD